MENVDVNLGRVRLLGIEWSQTCKSRLSLSSLSSHLEDHSEAIEFICGQLHLIIVDVCRYKPQEEL